MKILVTGARGFVGRNLCAQLKNIRDGKARGFGFAPAGRGTAEQPSIDEVFEYDLASTPEQLDVCCREADFVFNLAGVNRPKDAGEFMEGNFGFASTLLDTLKRHGSKAPVMLSSSVQASLSGRFGDSEYGRSKKAGEDLFLRYGEENGVKVLVYRFPNLYGKWCRPNYNSAIATFCHNIANGLPITVNDPSVELEVLYIDDLVDEMMEALHGREHRCEFDGLTVVPAPSCHLEHKKGIRQTAQWAFGPFLPEGEAERSAPAGGESAGGTSACGRHAGETVTGNSQPGRYCYCPVTHRVTLGEIVGLLHRFNEMPDTLLVPEIPADSFAKRLYSTFLSYLPKERAVFDLKMNSDARGSFTELVHTGGCGQVSVNISRPGITKGGHWHHSKWEQFIVVKGHGLIRMRPENPRPDQLDEDGNPQILEYEVSGDRIRSVIMLPGYTHDIVNLSDTEDLVTVMYCNEIFDPERPDTYADPVDNRSRQDDRS